jgi:hypothetical protein
LGGAVLGAIVNGFVEVFLNGFSRDGRVWDRVAFATKVVNEHEHDGVGNFPRYVTKGGVLDSELEHYKTNIVSFL